MDMFLKKLIIFAFLLLFVSRPAVHGQDIPLAKVSFTYIANEGFLIKSGESKILVDVLFGGIKGNWCEQPSDSVLNNIINGLPPFDSVDVLLVSHYHIDHFNEKMVSDFMQNNSGTILVCPDQVNHLLEKNPAYNNFFNRIKPVQASDNVDTTIITGETQIKALRLSHGSCFEKDTITGEVTDLHKNVENIAYIVRTDYCTFLHGGDASIASFEKNKTCISSTDTMDIAFMDRIFMKPEGMKIIAEVVKPEKLVFMHIEPSRVEYYKTIISDFPEMTVFSKSMETKYFK